MSIQIDILVNIAISSVSKSNMEANASCKRLGKPIIGTKSNSFIVLYLDAKDVTTLDLSDSIYTLGTLKVHHARQINTDIIDIYFNSKLRKFL